MKRIVACILLSLFLTACASAVAAPLPLSLPTPTDDPAPRPLLPTATAQVFTLKATSTPLPTRTPAATANTYAAGPASFPPGVNPLTGLVVSDPSLLERRPMAIKVTNFPRSVRPQWGLTLADHVYEYYLENQITRFIAVFYGNDAARVGPVRSGRFFDEHIMRMYKASLTFADADPRVIDPWLESDLKPFLVLERPNNCPPLCRIGSKYNYNTLYAETSKLGSYLAERRVVDERQNLDGLRFQSAIPFSARAGTRVEVSYSFVDYNRWEFDPSSSRYLRFSEAQDRQVGEGSYAPLLDSLTATQVATDNLVVLLVNHQYYIHTDTTEMVKMDLQGTGKAFAFRDGRMAEIYWQRSADDSLLTLLNTDGTPYPLKPGNIWFQVIGASSEVGDAGEGAWEFVFHIP